MKLKYHKGNNFGDALNPLIFGHYMKNVFDESEEQIFLGIGSILGLKKGKNSTKKIIVFSTGYAAGNINTYGEVPIIDNKYDIFCVRGPKTAELLNLDYKLAIADGAILLNKIYPFAKVKKKYKYSYMPHVGSESMFDWQKFIEELGINFISPKADVEEILENISASEFLLTEAMHGAIVADAFRVPWKAVNGYKEINVFKWEDYCESMDLKYRPLILPRLYKKKYLKTLVFNKLRAITNRFILNKVVDMLYPFYCVLYKKRVKKKLLNNDKDEFSLSGDTVLENKIQQLEEKIIDFKIKYDGN